MRPELARAVLQLAAGLAPRSVSRPYFHEGHKLHGRPLQRRETGLLEATCEHGVGHPIPESVAYMREMGLGESWGIHGCDGCCS